MRALLHRRRHFLSFLPCSVFLFLFHAQQKGTREEKAENQPENEKGRHIFAAMPFLLAFFTNSLIVIAEFAFVSSSLEFRSIHARYVRNPCKTSFLERFFGCISHRDLGRKRRYAIAEKYLTRTFRSFENQSWLELPLKIGVCIATQCRDEFVMGHSRASSQTSENCFEC